jgi:hypothetical protein
MNSPDFGGFKNLGDIADLISPSDKTAGSLPALIILIIFLSHLSHNGAVVVKLGNLSMNSEDILDKNTPLYGMY